MALAVIFRPQNLKSSPTLRLSAKTSIYLWYPMPRLTKAKSGTRDDVELGKLPLKSGLNFIDKAEWEAVINHPSNKQALEQMNRAQALSVYVPDDENPVGATSDYKNLQVVQDILENCSDIVWINTSLARDTRREVFEMGRERIAQIQEAQSDRRMRSNAMETAY